MRRSGGGMLRALNEELGAEQPYDGHLRRGETQVPAQSSAPGWMRYAGLAADTRPGQALITSTKGSHAMPESGSKTRSR
jgi:hypothetical protein